MTRWKDYGGRGIRVCDEWRTFAGFYADMGERPSKGHSIERKDADGNYEPGNCVWATDDVQRANKQDTIYVEWEGKRRALVTLCTEMGIESGLVSNRLKTGWSLERALKTPRRPGGPVAKAKEMFHAGSSIDAVMRQTGMTFEAARKTRYRMKVGHTR